MTTLCNDRNTTLMLECDGFASTEDACEEVGPHMLLSASFEEQEAIFMSSVHQGELLGVVDGEDQVELLDIVDAEDQVELLDVVQDDDEVSVFRNISNRSGMLFSNDSFKGDAPCGGNGESKVQGEDDEVTETTHQMSQTLSYSLSSCSSFATPGNIGVFSPTAALESSSSHPLLQGSISTRSSFPSSIKCQTGDLTTRSRRGTSGTINLEDSITPSMIHLHVSPRARLARKTRPVAPSSPSVSNMTYHRRTKSTTDVVESSMIWLRSSMLAQDIDSEKNSFSHAGSPPRKTGYSSSSCSSERSNEGEDDVLLGQEEHALWDSGPHQSKGTSDRSSRSSDRSRSSVFRRGDGCTSSATLSDDKDEILDPLLDSQHFRADDPDLNASEAISEVPWVVSCSFDNEEPEDALRGVEHKNLHGGDEQDAIISYQQRRKFRRSSLSSLNEEPEQGDGSHSPRHVQDTSGYNSSTDDCPIECCPHLLHNDLIEIFESDQSMNKRLYTRKKDE